MAKELNIGGSFIIMPVRFSDGLVISSIHCLGWERSLLAHHS
ncbi:MAG: hypothetical protein RMZ69_10030 [Nostoc sp. ChiQUE01a]|nr:hypothetical protein [Nostoc sp. ChiQUE01a]